VKRALIGVGIAIVALNVVIRELDRAVATPGGPTSSAYATAPEGLAAYAELARRNGHPVVRSRERLADATLAPGSTLVILEPEGLTRSDGEGVREFVEAGGRLVAGGEPRTWLGSIVPDPPEWEDRRLPVSRPSPGASLGEVERVDSPGSGAWRNAGGWQPALGAPDGGLLAVEGRLGQGEVFLLADPSPLQNRALANADNAALGVALAGRPGREVVFSESVHGYGEVSGLAAIPNRWLWVLGGLCLAALVFALARGRRFGPPERAARELPPARVEYVEALAALLAKTKPRGAAAEPVRSAARERLGADPRATGARLGLSDEEVATVLGDGTEDRDVVFTGRALAKLERAGRQREERTA
jgi:hypothetical protein